MTVSRNMRGGPQYLDLQKIALKFGRPLHEFLQIHVLESFIDRLSRSPQRESFVLKGGALLPAYTSRRPTRDVDLQALSMSRERDELTKRIASIVNSRADDGVTFDPTSIQSGVIREDDAYSGVRFSMNAQIATARIRLHLDVSFGDPIVPEPRAIELPRLIGDSILVLGYPLEMVLSEKIVTALTRGVFNTRWRDFVDVVGITRRNFIDGSTLVGSVNRVSEHRQVEREPLDHVLNEFGKIGQSRWLQWREKQLLADFVPESFDVVVREFIHFAGPVVGGSAAGKRWSPLAQKWETDGRPSGTD